MRLIDADEVVKAIDNHTFDTADGLCLDEDITIILEELQSVSIEQLKWERDTAIQQLRELGYDLGQKPKKGEWLERTVENVKAAGVEEIQSARCSVCGLYHTTPYMYYFSEYKYCPNCGAYMETEHD